MERKSNFTTFRLVFIALMAAIVCVVTFFRFPLLGSKVHFANSMCLLSGLLLGPVGGGLAAGLGSAIYDFTAGYAVVELLITFVSKFLMAYICALVAGGAPTKNKARTAAACVIGALSYVALYMLKTFVFQRFVYGYPYDTVWATMLSKLPASLINAVFAFITAPIIYAALIPVLNKSGIKEKLR